MIHKTYIHIQNKFVFHLKSFFQLKKLENFIDNENDNKDSIGRGNAVHDVNNDIL